MNKYFQIIEKECRECRRSGAAGHSQGRQAVGGLAMIDSAHVGVALQEEAQGLVLPFLCVGDADARADDEGTRGE